MMKQTKMLVSLVTAMTLSASLVSCGTSSTPSEGSTASTSNSGTTSAGDKTTLNVVTEMIGDNLNYTQNWNSWFTVRYCVGETLVKFDQDGSFIPWLAESWEPNEDATSWTFKLREDVLFSNGVEMTATKVKESIEFLYENTDPANGGMGYPQGYFTYTSIEADDEAFTVTINSAVPVIDMPGCMAYPWTLIVEVEETATRNLEIEGPIGTGPYKVESYAAESLLKLSANEYFWDGEVPFETINAVQTPDSKTRYLALMDGSADIAFNLTQADRNALDSSAFVVDVASSTRIGNTYFNLDSELEDQTLREAIVMAIDGSTIADITTAGSYVYDFAVLPTSYAFGGDELNFPHSYDPEGAMALLDSAGIVDTDGDGWRELNGEQIVIDYVASNYRFMDVIPQAHTALIESIGVKVNLIPTDGHIDELNARAFDMIVNSEVTLPTGDPQRFLAHWYTGSEGNYSNYSNDNYDAIYDDLLVTVDVDERADMIRDLQQILIDEAVNVVYGFYGCNTCYSTGVTGVEASTSDFYWLTQHIKAT